MDLKRKYLMIGRPKRMNWAENHWVHGSIGSMVLDRWAVSHQPCYGSIRHHWPVTSPFAYHMPLQIPTSDLIRDWDIGQCMRGGRLKSPFLILDWKVLSAGHTMGSVLMMWTVCTLALNMPKIISVEQGTYAFLNHICLCKRWMV